MRSFVEWFDPNNIDHVRAYAFLHTHGRWPGGFWESFPKDVKMGPHWQFEIMSKMADCWVEHVTMKDQDLPRYRLQRRNPATGEWHTAVTSVNMAKLLDDMEEFETRCGNGVRLIDFKGKVLKELH